MLRLGAHSVKNLAEQTAESADRPAIGLHGLRVLNQANGRRELRVLESARQAGHGLGVSDAGRQLEHFLSQMIDPVQMAASARDENSLADVIDERFLLEFALKELEGFPQPQMNDRVQRFPLDFLPGEARVVLQ